MFKISSKNKEELSPLEIMERAAFQTIVAPFNGMEVPVKVRCPNEVQLRACGAFQIIDLRTEEEKKGKLDDHELIQLINQQEAILKEALVSPTYAEIVEKVYGHDYHYETLRKELEEVREKIKQVKEPAERNMYSMRLRILEMQTGYVLPVDFTGFIVAWALGIDRSDIRKLTREVLLEAAVLADRGGDNPADHLDGNFTKYHDEQINKTAWQVYSDYLADKNTEKKGKTSIRGGTKKVS